MQTYSTPQNIINRLFGWWYFLAVPPASSENLSWQERERQRRAKLTSIILLIQLLYHIGSLIVGWGMIPVLIPVAVSTGLITFGVILNRTGKTQLAGFIMLLTVEAGISSFILGDAFARGGINDLTITATYLLIPPDLIAISLFSAAIALPFSIFNCLFMFASLVLFPKTAQTQALLALAGVQLYYFPLAAQIIATAVASFWAHSANQELKRADQAEEVVKLSQTLAVQQQLALEEKQQLEKSVQQIVEVHMQVANGNFNARVPLDRQNVLWSIAGSLNNLLARLQRWRQDAQQLERTDQAIQQTLHDIQLARKQASPIILKKTGTRIDPLITELTRDKMISHF